MRFQTRQVGLVCRQSAASGDDGFSAMRQILNRPPLPFAESRLAVLGEDLGDGFARPGDNHLVRIQESEMYRLGDETSHARLARAHEPNQGKVMECARSVHSIRLARFWPPRTQIFIRVDKP